MILVLLLGLLALSLAACGGSDTNSAARQPLDYASDSRWLCRPDMYSDECRGADLTATELLSDGTSRVVKHVVATDPKYDCFYVYPTVALSGPVGSVDESILSNHAPMLDALLSQAARFTGQCRVFAPLYRQITLPTYASPSVETYLEEPYVDIAAAFDYFVKSIGDRPFVVISHSQGAQLSRRLLQRKIDPDPALRTRLITALVIGGDTLIDSFTNIPGCTTEAQSGCVISYRSYAEGYGPIPTIKPLPSGLLCTNPASIAGGEGRLGGAYFATATKQPVLGTWAKWPDSIKTPFVLMRDFYTSACVKQAIDGDYLEIRVRPKPSDTRTNPIPFDNAYFSPKASALHVLDYDFPLDDLMRLVAAKATAKGL